MCNASRSCDSDERGGRVRVTNVFSRCVPRSPSSNYPDDLRRFATPPPTYGCQADANYIRNRTFGGFRNSFSPRPHRRAYSYPGPSTEPPGGLANTPDQFPDFGLHLDDYFGHESTVGRHRFEDTLETNQVNEPRPPPPKPPKRESLIEWFDRTVEAELEKRRDPYLSRAVRAMVDPASFPTSSRTDPHPLNAESSESELDIEAELCSGLDTELLLAVDKLAKAEALVAMERAARAAKETAAKAPPKQTEEAAAAGVRQYHKEISSVVKQTVPGIKNIEVVGYKGIMQPKTPKRSE